MAQPTVFRLEYLGAVKAEKNKEYTAAGMAALFTGATSFILKSRGSRDNPIMVSINKSVAFEITYDEISTFDGQTALTYVFNQDCIIAVCKEIPTI